jgi:hypothetical protein
MLSKGSSFVLVFSAVLSGALGDRRATSIFTQPGISIAEAPAANLLQLITHPDALAVPLRRRHASPELGENQIRKRQSGSQVINTIFDGVYPVANVTWGNKDGVSTQSFISFIDTG